MRADSLCFRASVLLLAALLPFFPVCVHQMLNVLQPALTKSWNCTGRSNDCCSDCIAMGDDNYNLMFSIKFYAAILFLPLSGYMMDKLGNSVSVLISACGVLGCCLIAIGGSVRESAAMLPLIFSGTGFFGLCVTSSHACRQRIIGFWFADRNLRVAFGVAASITHSAALLSFTLTEKLRELLGLQWTLWCCVLVASAGLVCAVLVSALDAWGNRQLSLTEELKEEQRSAGILDLRHFGCEFWLLMLAYALFATTYIFFMTNSVEFIHEKFSFTKQHAAVTTGFLQTVGIVGCPALGLLLDRVGRSILWFTLATFVMLPALAMLAFTDIHPLVGTLAIGAAYSFQNPASSASVPLVVSRQSLGVAYSLLMFAAGISGICLHSAAAAVLGHEMRLPLYERRIRWQKTLCLTMAAAFAAFAFAATLSVLSCCRGNELVSGRRRKDSGFEEIKDDDNSSKEDRSDEKTEIVAKYGTAGQSRTPAE